MYDNSFSKVGNKEKRTKIKEQKKRIKRLKKNWTKITARAERNPERLYDLLDMFYPEGEKKRDSLKNKWAVKKRGKIERGA